LPLRTTKAERTLRNGFTWRQGVAISRLRLLERSYRARLETKFLGVPYRHAQAKRISLAIGSQFEQPGRQECFLRLGALIFRQIGNGFIQHGFQHQDSLGVENSVAAHNLPSLSLLPLLPHKNSASLKCGLSVGYPTDRRISFVHCSAILLAVSSMTAYTVGHRR
jgi:hypothetical protein